MVRVASDRGDDGVRVAQSDGADVDHAVRQHDRLHQRVPVCLDEARHHACVFQVHGLRVRTDPGLDIGPVAHRDDAAVGHCYRFGGGLPFIDGENSSGEHEIGSGHPISMAATTCAGGKFGYAPPNSGRSIERSAASGMWACTVPPSIAHCMRPTV
jgi:hypothetical protein